MLNANVIAQSIPIGTARVGGGFPKLTGLRDLAASIRALGGRPRLGKASVTSMGASAWPN